MSSAATEIKQDIAADSPSMKLALGSAALLVSLPGSFYFAWSAVTSASTGWISAGVACTLIALLPVFVGIISVRRRHNFNQNVALVTLAGIVQLVGVVVLPFWVLSL